MATYSAMQVRIADELARSDLTSQIAQAILDSILYYERFRWPWNENVFTFSTVIGQQAYGTAANSNIPNIVDIDSITVTTAGSLNPLLTPRTKAIFDVYASTTSASSDPPTDYCYHALQLKLFPTPSAVRVITVSGIIRLTALALGSDSNAWTTDGEQLIRTAAKIQILETVIRSADAYNEAMMLRQNRLAALEGDIAGENLRRISAGNRRIDAIDPNSSKGNSVNPSAPG